MVLSELIDRHNENFTQGFESSGSETIKTALTTEVNMLRQEINQLNAKLFAKMNIQRQYEEQVKKRHALEQENKALRTDLEKANVRHTIAQLY